LIRLVCYNGHFSIYGKLITLSDRTKDSISKLWTCKHVDKEGRLCGSRCDMDCIVYNSIILDDGVV
jgi:hypothetical protein